jgi:hypothetical protein
VNTDLLGEYQISPVYANTYLNPTISSIALKSLKNANALCYIGAYTNLVTVSYVDLL